MRSARRYNCPIVHQRRSIWEKEILQSIENQIEQNFLSRIVFVRQSSLFGRVELE